MRRATKIGSIGAAAALLGALVPAVPALAGDDHGGQRRDHHPVRLLLAAQLAGSVLSDPPLFGALRGGAPWQIRTGSVVVTGDGRMDVRIRGLVIPSDTGGGSNPLPQLSASLVCNGTELITTAPVAFSPAGDAHISTRVMVPARCLAPAVLVHPNANAAVYIAASGLAG